MFHVKTQLNKDAAIVVDITDKNVFTTCPDCGKEVQVDLTDFAGDEEFDLYGTEVSCPECSKRRWLTKQRCGCPCCTDCDEVENER